MGARIEERMTHTWQEKKGVLWSGVGGWGLLSAGLVRRLEAKSGDQILSGVFQESVLGLVPFVHSGLVFSSVTQRLRCRQKRGARGPPWQVEPVRLSL